DDAAAAAVAEAHADRDRDHEREEHRAARHRKVLDDAVWHAERAVPVGRGREPVPDLSEEVHVQARLTRAQGVSSRSSASNTRSAATASTTDPTRPTTSGVRKSRIRPSRMSEPSPPCPMRAVTVTRPTVVT